ncbi:hypothetical protein ACP0HM_20670 [Escherichia coli]
MPLVIVAIGVILLLLLMIRFKMNGFIALVPRGACCWINARNAAG